MPASFRTLFLVSLLAGLATSLFADEIPPAADGRGQLLVIRPDHAPIEIILEVELNGQGIGELAPNRYLLANLEPGRHLLRITGGGQSLEQTFSIGPGEGAYWHVIVDSGFYNYKLRVVSLSEEVASRYLIRTKAAHPGAITVTGVGAPLAEEAIAVAAAASVASAPVQAGAEGAVSATGKRGPDISIVTLGVADLTRAVAFYSDGLGFSLSTESSKDIAFFDLEGSWLALYPRQALAQDVGIAAGDRAAFPGFTLAHNVGGSAEVNAFMDKAAAAGAEIVKPAAETFWGGYSGYFRDLDGFLWEVAWNPQLPLD